MTPENDEKLLILSSSPHAHCGSSIRGIMADVLIALIPAVAASLWFFKLQALILLLTCTATCVLSEWACRAAMRRDPGIGDLSACVTGVLLALTLPPATPVWMAIAGSVFSIAVAKQVFGGLGYNPFNPALAGRAFMLISFTGAMTTWSRSGWVAGVAKNGADAVTQATTISIDATTSATPLAFIKYGGGGLDWSNLELIRRLCWGEVNGSIGEVSAVALLIGGIYLLLRKVITWHIPVSYLLTVALYAFVAGLCGSGVGVLPHLLCGGLLLGAFFMATDMVTSPITPVGRLIFGFGCGVLTMVIRTSKTGAYPEGVCFSILIMNSLVPLIDRFTRNRVFGTGRTKNRTAA